MYVYVSALDSALVPAGPVTVTLTTPEPGGAIAVNDVAEATATLVASIDPKVTVSPAEKLVPVSVTTVPPAEGPDVGFSAPAVEAEAVGFVQLTITGGEIAWTFWLP